MHESVMDWLEAVIEAKELRNVNRVLEVGALNVNGSPRPLFESSVDYFGVDLYPGPGVDAVVECDHDYESDFGRFDVVICTETLEHDPFPWVTILNMATALMPGGYLIVTARGFGPDMSSVAQPGAIRTYGSHDYPHDYWRFSEAILELLFQEAGLEVVSCIPDTDPLQPGVFIVGRK